jgi:cytochrome c553
MRWAALVAALAIVALAVAAWSAPTQSDAPSTPQTFEQKSRAFLERYCAECHSGAEAEGEFTIARATDTPRLALDDWRAIRKQLASGKMPPRKARQPSNAERGELVAAATSFLAAHAPAFDPGTVTLRRLNRSEYRNSVRDLCGVELDVEALLPPDDVGYGFDNIGDVLSMPDILLEKYVDAAERVAARAIEVADPLRPPARRVRDDEVKHTERFSQGGDGWGLYTNGFVGADLPLERRGEYVLRARAWASQAGDEAARMEFRLAGKRVAVHDVLAARGDAKVYETRVELEAEPVRFEAWFVNDFWNPDEPDRAKRDRNLYVEWLEIAGPVGALVPTHFQQRVLGVELSAEEVVEHLARRAWRRPVKRDEVRRLVELAPKHSERELVVRTALEAILASPHFLFRVERDPEELAPGAVRDLDGFEFATRLAYFLWSSAPDDELLDAAEKAEFVDAEARARHVRRMLRDPRASELTRNFAAQWLQLRQLDRATPDPARFPNFDDDLRAAMRAETELLFEAVLREERALSELVDPDFTFLNAPLARHYGLGGVRGETMQRVRLDPEQRAVRGGLLQHASVLTVTSNPTRTSVVKRGKWILETLLGAPPLAPEPGVDSLDESVEAVRAASLRERLAKHREDAKCAVCHDRMDNLGFALEHYDPTGQWRTQADGFAVDASGEFEDGARFVGAAALERRLASDPAFVRCALEKLAIYALGRGLRPADEPALDAAVAALPRDPTLTDVILAVVELDAFRRRTVPEPSPR